MSRRQLAVETSLRPPSLFHTLARDALILMAVLLIPLIGVVYGVPLLDEAAMALFAFSVTTIAWLLLVIAATFWGIRHVQQPAERRFWARLGIAFTCWALADVLYAIGAFDPNGPAGSMVQDALYLLYYLAWIFALEARPHLESERGLHEDGRDFAWAGRVL